MSPARLFHVAAAGVLASGLLVGGVVRAADDTTADPDSATATAVGPRVDTVNLITGDRVDVSRDGTGRMLATLRPSEGRTRTLARTVEHGDAVYVIPQVAEPLIRAGTLDRELFNVTRLVETARVTGSTALPLIVTYAGDPNRRQLARRSPPEPSQVVDRLPSIDSVALRVSTRAARPFWRDLTSKLSRPNARSAGADIAKVWLDKVITPDLADSVPQIGAPQAWAAGYDGTGTKVAVLDTGYDPTHRDLDGQVVDSADFSGEGIVDRHGHGTHVAATVAGTGAASDGQRPGVAPGADLLIGKVMDASGSGLESWLIDAMEWTVAQDADVVNMSLSTDVSDGSDPLSQAVDRLSATSDTLFVATAGNTGPNSQTSRAPGNADTALSVAAVDKSDALAAFSSRGPRVSDYAIKPDISAPGVDIIAARAAGTSMDRPVDDLYTMASGTSMAAPHVAGAAAILAQRHPAWGGERIKAALMSTSTRLPETVYEAGSGRVDVARAVSQPVVAVDGSVSFGRFAYTDSPVASVSRTITYANTADHAIDLDLSLDVTDEDGVAAPDGLFALGSDTVTVPAGGTASVDVTVDPNDGARQLYGGQVVATNAAGDVEIHTAVGAFLEPEMVDLVIDGVNQDGLPASGTSGVDVWNLDTDAWLSGGFGGKGGAGPARFRVPVGTYSISAFLWNMDASGRFGRELALVAEPEIDIEADTHLTLDATAAQPSDPVTPRPTEHRELTVGYYRAADGNEFSTHYLMDRYVPTVYLGRIEPVSRGDLDVTEHWELYAPELTMAAGDDQLDQQYAIGSTRIDGYHRYPVTDAGQARPSDLDGVDLRGKLALIEYADDLDVSAAARATEEAGARAALVSFNRPGFFLSSVDDRVSIPVVTVDQATGLALRERLAAGERVTIAARGVPDSPYVYDLMPYWSGEVPTTIDRVVEHADLARFEARYHGMGTSQVGSEIRFPFRPYDSFALRQEIAVPVPSTRTEWVTPGEVTWHQITWAAVGVNDSALVDTRREFTPGNEGHDDWFAPVLAAGVPMDNDHYGPWGIPGYREGDTLTVLIRSGLDSQDHYSERLRGAARFYRDGVLIAEGSSIAGSLPASPDPARYRLELDTARDTDWWRLATRTRSAWEFDSARPAAGEREQLGLLQVDYDVSTDLRGRVPAGRPTAVRLTVHRQGSAAPLRDADLRAWVSYDDGDSWRPAGTRERRGTFKTLVRPGRHATSVSLRVRAKDPAGHAIEQEIVRALGVRR